MIIKNTNDPDSIRIKATWLYHCTGCQYFGRDYDNNDIRCNCKGSPFYLDVPPGNPCNYWESKHDS